MKAIEKAYQDYKDGFSSLEGYVMNNPQLRQSIDDYLHGIVTGVDYTDDKSGVE